MRFLKVCQKSVASLVVVCFVTTSFVVPPPAHAQDMPSLAAESSFIPLGIPAELASIEEIFIPDSKKDSLSPLIHIQSVHAHPETQMKIFGLLKFLDQKYGVGSLLIEGAGEQLNPSFIRFFENNKLNVQIAEKLVEKGELTGAELFLIETEREVPAYGLEEPSLYRANLETFQNVMLQRPLTGEFVQDVRGSLDRLETLLLQPEARRLLRSSESFDAGQMELLSYVLELERNAKTLLGVDLRDFKKQIDWPQLIRLLKLQETESELDPEKIQSERQKLVGFLKEIKIDPSVVEGFESISFSPYQTGMVYDPGFRKNDLPRYLAERLLEGALDKGFSFEQFPSFTRYLKAAILQSELEAERLFQEIDRLFETLVRSASNQEEEWTLIGLVHKERLFERLFDLELTPKDYAKIEGENHEPRPLVRFLLGVESLYEKTPSGLITKLVPDNIEALESVYGEAVRFYQLAKERENTMVNKILEKMPQFDSSVGAGFKPAPTSIKQNAVTILITGGFHTDGLSRAFRNKRVPYTILTPRISEKVSAEAYVSMLLGEKKTAFDTAYLEPDIDSQSQAVLTEMRPENRDLVMTRAEVRVVLEGIVEVVREERAMSAGEFAARFNRSLYAKDRRAEIRLDESGQNLIPSLRGELLPNANGVRVMLGTTREERDIPAPFARKMSRAEAREMREISDENAAPAGGLANRGRQRFLSPPLGTSSPNKPTTDSVVSRLRPPLDLESINNPDQNENPSGNGTPQKEIPQPFGIENQRNQIRSENRQKDLTSIVPTPGVESHMGENISEVTNSQEIVSYLINTRRAEVRKETSYGLEQPQKLADGNSGDAKDILKRPAVKLPMIGDNQGRSGDRMLQFDVASLLADGYVAFPLKGGYRYATRNQRGLGHTKERGSRLDDSWRALLLWGPAQGTTQSLRGYFSGLPLSSYPGKRSQVMPEQKRPHIRPLLFLRQPLFSFEPVSNAKVNAQESESQAVPRAASGPLWVLRPEGSETTGRQSPTLRVEGLGEARGEVRSAPFWWRVDKERGWGMKGKISEGGDASDSGQLDRKPRLPATPRSGQWPILAFYVSSSLIFFVGQISQPAMKRITSIIPIATLMFNPVFQIKSLRKKPLKVRPNVVISPFATSLLRSGANSFLIWNSPWEEQLRGLLIISQSIFYGYANIFPRRSPARAEVRKMTRRRLLTAVPTMLAAGAALNAQENSLTEEVSYESLKESYPYINFSDLERIGKMDPELNRRLIQHIKKALDQLKKVNENELLKKRRDEKLGSRKLKITVTGTGPEDDLSFNFEDFEELPLKQRSIKIKDIEENLWKAIVVHVLRIGFLFTYSEYNLWKDLSGQARISGNKQLNARLKLLQERMIDPAKNPELWGQLQLAEMDADSEANKLFTKYLEIYYGLRVPDEPPDPLMLKFIHLLLTKGSVDPKEVKRESSQWLLAAIVIGIAAISTGWLIYRRSWLKSLVKEKDIQTMMREFPDVTISTTPSIKRPLEISVRGPSRQDVQTVLGRLKTKYPRYHKGEITALENTFHGELNRIRKPSRAEVRKLSFGKESTPKTELFLPGEARLGGRIRDASPLSGQRQQIDPPAGVSSPFPDSSGSIQRRLPEGKKLGHPSEFELQARDEKGHTSRIRSTVPGSSRKTLDPSFNLSTKPGNIAFPVGPQVGLGKVQGLSERMQEERRFVNPPARANQIPMSEAMSRVVTDNGHPAASPKELNLNGEGANSLAHTNVFVSSPHVDGKVGDEGNLSGVHGGATLSKGISSVNESTRAEPASPMLRRAGGGASTEPEGRRRAEVRYTEPMFPNFQIIKKGVVIEGAQIRGGTSPIHLSKSYPLIDSIDLSRIEELPFDPATLNGVRLMHVGPGFVGRNSEKSEVYALTKKYPGVSEYHLLDPNKLVFYQIEWLLRKSKPNARVIGHLARAQDGLPLKDFGFIFMADVADSRYVDPRKMATQLTEYLAPGAILVNAGSYSLQDYAPENLRLVKGRGTDIEIYQKIPQEISAPARAEVREIGEEVNEKVGSFGVVSASGLSQSGPRGRESLRLPPNKPSTQGLEASIPPLRIDEDHTQRGQSGQAEPDTDFKQTELPGTDEGSGDEAGKKNSPEAPGEPSQMGTLSIGKGIQSSSSGDVPRLPEKSYNVNKNMIIYQFMPPEAVGRAEARRTKDESVVQRAKVRKTGFAQNVLLTLALTGLFSAFDTAAKAQAESPAGSSFGVTWVSGKSPVQIQLGFLQSEKANRLAAAKTLLGLVKEGEVRPEEERVVMNELQSNLHKSAAILNRKILKWTDALEELRDRKDNITNPVRYGKLSKGIFEDLPLAIAKEEEIQNDITAIIRKIAAETKDPWVLRRANEAMQTRVDGTWSSLSRYERFLARQLHEADRDGKLRRNITRQFRENIALGGREKLDRLKLEGKEVFSLGKLAFLEPFKGREAEDALSALTTNKEILLSYLNVAYTNLQRVDNELAAGVLFAEAQIQRNDLKEVVGYVETILTGIARRPNGDVYKTEFEAAETALKQVLRLLPKEEKKTEPYQRVWGFGPDNKMRLLNDLKLLINEVTETKNGPSLLDQKPELREVVDLMSAFRSRFLSEGGIDLSRENDKAKAFLDEFIDVLFRDENFRELVSSSSAKLGVEELPKFLRRLGFRIRIVSRSETRSELLPGRALLGQLKEEETVRVGDSIIATGVLPTKGATSFAPPVLATAPHPELFVQLSGPLAAALPRFGPKITSRKLMDFFLARVNGTRDPRIAAMLAFRIFGKDSPIFDILLLEEPAIAKKFLEALEEIVDLSQGTEERVKGLLNQDSTLSARSLEGSVLRKNADEPGAHVVLLDHAPTKGELWAILLPALINSNLFIEVLIDPQAEVTEPQIQALLTEARKFLPDEERFNIPYVTPENFKEKLDGMPLRLHRRMSEVGGVPEKVEDFADKFLVTSVSEGLWEKLKLDTVLNPKIRAVLYGFAMDNDYLPKFGAVSIIAAKLAQYRTLSGQKDEYFNIEGRRYRVTDEALGNFFKRLQQVFAGFEKMAASA